jgi:V/A-type H+-transporting ATPase subunit K
MELNTLELLKWIGIGGCFALSALGSAIGMAANGPAVIGAWKKCYIQKKPAPFILLVFGATCLSNIIYGFILLLLLPGSAAATAGTAEGAYMLLTLGLGSGLAISAVAITQAMCAAAAADAYAETGQGFANCLMIVGIAETISLFAVVFVLMAAG